MKFYKRSQFLLTASVLVLAIPSVAPAGDVLLQYFEGSWETIERRMPDVFLAGYDAIWVPPPGKADTGGFSVGYDVYDRFNLGNRNDRTLYGTEQGFLRLSREMDNAGIDLYIDAVLNHNGFRDSSTPGFVDGGDYPGFVTTIPDVDDDGDFHGAFEGGDLSMRLAGLIDIAQEKNHQYTRHPIVGSENPIPNEPFNEKNRHYYWPYDGTATPYQDNATGLLLRYLQWMVKANGVDGFRIDAEKHIPTWFFNDFYDGALKDLATDPITGAARTPFSFGEVFDGNFELLGSYIRKDGFGNRDVLDFPLYFAIDNVFNGGGFGDMTALESASVDASDGNANDGSRGVLFAGSHDDEAPGLGNVAYAHILTRTGFPVVYYNAHEFGTDRDFPKDGRGDAIGNFGDTITKLVNINKEYIRGGHATRWITSDLYVYERLNAALIGLNDRGDSGYDEVTVQTAFPGGTVLVELTGHATSAFIDPNDDIFDTVTVNGDGTATIRVPRNSSSSFHGLGYVIYGPQAPVSTLTITNANGTIGPDSSSVDEGKRRLATLHIVNDDTINVTVQTAGGSDDDNALIKLNYGVDINGGDDVFQSGDFAGFELFPNASPRHTGGTGEYSVNIDATNLEDGYQYIETVAFLHRDSGPAIFDMQRKVVYLDRVAPEVSMQFPGQTGDGDIQSPSYEAVFLSDRTVNSVHVLRNVSPSATDEQIISMVNGGNKANKVDRLEWRHNLTGLTHGTLELTVVAFEETGTHSITRFGNIDVDLGEEASVHGWQLLGN